MDGRTFMDTMFIRDRGVGLDFVLRFLDGEVVDDSETLAQAKVQEQN